NQPVVVTGANFSPNAIAWVSLPCDALGFRKALTTVRNSSTQIVATIPIRCAGTYSLEIANPQPGGGLSAPVALVVPSVVADGQSLVAAGAAQVVLAAQTDGSGTSTSNSLPAITSIDAGNATWNSTSSNDSANAEVVIAGVNFAPGAVALVSVPCDGL